MGIKKRKKEPIKPKYCITVHIVLTIPTNDELCLEKNKKHENNKNNPPPPPHYSYKLH